MSKNTEPSARKRLISTIMLASGGSLLLAGVGVLAMRGNPDLGLGLMVVGFADLGLAGFFRTRA
jgi:hypothetical protein